MSPSDHPDSAVRRATLMAQARAAKGFMPDDEGLALYEAAVRAGRSAPPATLVEIGAWCGKSTVYLGARGRGHRSDPVQPRPPPRFGGEPAGWEHHDLEVVDPAPGASTPCRSGGAPWSTPNSAAASSAWSGPSAAVASQWSTPARAVLHRRRPRRRAGLGRLPRLGPTGRRWADGWPSTTCSPTPLTAGDRPTSCGARLWSPGEFAEDGECGSLRVLRRVAPADGAR